MKQESISQTETGISRFEFDYRRRVVFTDRAVRSLRCIRISTAR